ncbi:MAG: hypothetical protein ACNI27_06290 [Desulfovibrio sp.]
MKKLPILLALALTLAICSGCFKSETEHTITGEVLAIKDIESFNALKKAIDSGSQSEKMKIAGLFINGQVTTAEKGLVAIWDESEQHEMRIKGRMATFTKMHLKNDEEWFYASTDEGWDGK